MPKKKKSAIVSYNSLRTRSLVLAYIYFNLLPQTRTSFTSNENLKQVCRGNGVTDLFTLKQRRQNLEPLLALTNIKIHNVQFKHNGL